jgi:HEAT repeat protein
MPSLTTEQIDAVQDAEALVRLLIDAGEDLPPRLRERILAFGPEVIPPLVALAEDEALSLATAPGEGWGPIHAVDLLADLHAEAAVQPMLSLLANTEWMTIIHGRVIQGLPRLGPPVLEPALAAYAGTSDPDLRRSLASVLAELKVHDERVYQILTGELEENLELGAMHLAEYGDPRALPLLSAAIDRYESRGDQIMINHALVELRAAIEDLGGELTPEQRAKIDRILEPDERRRREFRAAIERLAEQEALETLSARGHALAPEPHPSRAARKIGRNDPCPCGSGKKYKKCCLGK